MASLVVPAISLTIALSSFNIALIKLLFPTLGLPIIENLIVLSSFISSSGKSLVIVLSNSLIPILCEALTAINSLKPNS